MVSLQVLLRELQATTAHADAMGNATASVVIKVSSKDASGKHVRLHVFTG